jgi:HK97 gp10 family phage protein
MGMKVKVRGDLLATLTKVSAAARRGIERAVADETKAVAADMAEGAPVGDPKRGRRGKPPLGESIEPEVDGLRGRARVKARHGNILEHGTKSRPAQPFAKPAATTSRRRFPKRVATEVSKEIG